ncbi:MAG: hypothetical protein ABI042_18365 [Verrucomicrobiota bacterium]
MRYKIINILIKILNASRQRAEARIAKKAAKREERERHNSNTRRTRGNEEAFPQTFVFESFFTQELIKILTPGANEEMRFLTGPQLGPIRIVSRWAEPVSLDHQSRVYVGASAKSVAANLIKIIESGAQLHVLAHSHPGTGEGACFPSSIDVECLGRLQKSGSPAIGCIVTRDGFVRFFSIFTKFHVMVLGSGVREVSKNVFQITSQNSN